MKTELLIFLTPHVATDPDHLEQMREQEMDGTKLVPNAVDRNAFDQHMRGLERGDVGALSQEPRDEMIGPPATRPAEQESTTRPSRGGRRGGP